MRRARRMDWRGVTVFPHFWHRNGLYEAYSWDLWVRNAT